MRVLTAAQAREADARTIAGGTPGLVLMERASEAVARECARRGLLFKRTAYNFVSLAHRESDVDVALGEFRT